MTESDPYARTGDFDSDATRVETAQTALPERIGRYRIERLVGQGGFGLVYLATDEQLQRRVAIKVPHKRIVSSDGSAEDYLREAQTVANLDHPNIVPVFDVGASDEYPFFVVSKFVEGQDLSKRLSAGRLSYGEAASLITSIADALHHAHKQGIVHRDVKPGNTLIDQSGTPFLVDFGLALKEAEVGRASRYVGTVAYMSPEQARGEGHRVDGRSDIFSLGVVLYELLSGRKPFRGESQEEILTQVKTLDPRPPRQLDDRIPRELERICLKAMSKRASERYTTAKDMADDLRQFLAELTIDESQHSFDTVTLDRDHESTSRERLSPASRDRSASGSTGLPMASWEKEPLRIVPKGLRSFDEHDTDFFLELLPGPVDREGLPDSLRFWKTRIEETAADKTFAVGLIYGPTGCGKSSLVKAGLLPRLDESVIVVYIEATDSDTESRLSAALRRCCPDLPQGLTLMESLAAIRREECVAAGQKVLVVLDQFEQWLHAKRNEEHTELVDALRQCDGGRVQCIVMVRDDFWMPATRMMRELDIRLVEGHNSASVDLFQTRHARKVLTAFGRAFGDLTEGVKLSKSEQQFIEQAVDGLADEGKVICVRLALFAEMMKGKPWAVATLRQIGGAAGVGVAFLEETFSASTARPEHRYHQLAARAVLKTLLPEAGTDIKGHSRSRDQLLADSGYQQRPGDFDDLIRILDSDLRLITPTVVEGVAGYTSDAVEQSHYQLTHDYLVPSLREWLTRKQRETRAGRAELRLAELATLWSARPERRRLPSFSEWVNISTLTRRRHRSDAQRKMMAVATRSYAIAALVIGFVVAALGTGAFELRGRTHTNALVQRLKSAEISNVPRIVDDFAGYRRWADAELRAIVADSSGDARHRLYASLALLPVDDQQVSFLRERMLESEALTLVVIRDELQRSGRDVTQWLWQYLGDASAGRRTRFRAALALSPLDPPGDGDSRWSKHAEFLATQLVAEATTRPSSYTALVESLRPIRVELTQPLHAIYQEDDPVARNMATGLLVDYASDQPHVLADLLMDANVDQFAILFPLLAEPPTEAIESLGAEVAELLAGADSDGEKEHLAQRQANAGAALLRLGKPDPVWPLLEHSKDPRARSYLIHRVAPLGVDPALLYARLTSESNVSIRRALLLALGEYEIATFTESARVAMVSQVVSLFTTDHDAGVHASAEWLLRAWQQTDVLSEAREGLLTASDPQRQWIPTKSGHTMVVVDARDVSGIGHQFQVSDKEVTVEQFRMFKPYRWMPEENDRPEAAAGVVTWHTAIAYCQWLNEQEGIPEDQWCYPRFDPDDEGLRRFSPDLTKTGYRLPTAGEWEHAARAGAMTTRYYGETDELLPHYACYEQNSGGRIDLVGRLKPNDFGLFNMLGNVAEWNADSYLDDRVGISGSAYGSGQENLRVTSVGGALPNTKFNSYGFRIARTHAKQQGP